MAKQKFSISEKLLPLELVPVGSLFMHDGKMWLKTNSETEEGVIEAFQIGTGEFFWGGAEDAVSQSKVLVNPIIQEFTNGRN